MSSDRRDAEIDLNNGIVIPPEFCRDGDCVASRVLAHNQSERLRAELEQANRIIGSYQRQVASYDQFKPNPDQIELNERLSRAVADINTLEELREGLEKRIDKFAIEHQELGEKCIQLVSKLQLSQIQRDVFKETLQSVLNGLLNKVNRSPDGQQPKSPN